jgi:hypothetical protein
MQKQLFTALLLVTTLFVTAQRPTMNRLLLQRPSLPKKTSTLHSKEKLVWNKKPKPRVRLR